MTKENMIKELKEIENTIKGMEISKYLKITEIENEKLISCGIAKSTLKYDTKSVIALRIFILKEAIKEVRGQ